MASDTRNYPRKIFRVQARLTLPGMAPLRARTADISLQGMCLFISEQLKTGQACAIAFEAPLIGRHVPVVVNAKVVYSILSSTDGFRTGLQFAQLGAETERLLAQLMG